MLIENDSWKVLRLFFIANFFSVVSFLLMLWTVVALVAVVVGSAVAAHRKKSFSLIS